MMIKQRGFTLVELLITLVISSTIIAGLGQLLLQSKQTYKTQQTLSHMVEEGRYILEVLTKEIRRIGYLRNRAASTGGAVGSADTVFLEDIDALGSGITMAAGASIAGAFDENGFDGESHNVNKLVFRYQLNDKSELSASEPDYGSSPCTIGLTLDIAEDPTIVKHVVTIYLYVTYDDETQSQTLFCEAKRETIISTDAGLSWHPTQVAPDGDPVARPLLSNVEKLLVLYGVDTDVLPDNAANVYLRADGVIEWTTVVSIRLYVILRSEETNVAHSTPSYAIDGQPQSVLEPNERRLYRVFSTTIAPRATNH